MKLSAGFLPSNQFPALDFFHLRLPSLVVLQSLSPPLWSLSSSLVFVNHQPNFKLPARRLRPLTSPSLRLRHLHRHPAISRTFVRLPPVSPSPPAPIKPNRMILSIVVASNTVIPLTYLRLAPTSSSFPFSPPPAGPKMKTTTVISLIPTAAKLAIPVPAIRGHIAATSLKITKTNSKSAWPAIRVSPP